jgi:MarR family transcriptional regulator, transcriptional regulator for hemolysin
VPRKKPLESKAKPSGSEDRVSGRKEDGEPTLVRLTGSVSRSCRMYADRFVTRFGVSVSQAILLAELRRHDGCSQDELRVRVKLDKGNVTRALQRLEKNGFVRRRQDAADRRVVRVYATRKAVSTDRELHALAVRWNDRLTEGFSSEERQTLISLLLRMEANAQAMVSEDAD